MKRCWSLENNIWSKAFVLTLVIQESLVLSQPRSDQPVLLEKPEDPFGLGNQLDSTDTLPDFNTMALEVLDVELSLTSEARTDDKALLANQKAAGATVVKATLDAENPSGAKNSNEHIPDSPKQKGHKKKPKPQWKPSSDFLLPVSSLIGKCFDFPLQNFNHENNILAKYPNDPAHFVDDSESAVDFKVATYDGEKIVLSELLKEKPVVLVYGMYTCPAFQGYYSEKNPNSHMSKYDEWALVEKYYDQVSFIHLYGPEPHPKRPDKNFDTGKIIEFPWSTVRNAKTWESRRSTAELVKDDIHPEAYFVLDNLGGPTMIDHGVEEPPYNPVWCTYGPGARQAFLIGRNGRMYDVQAWFHASTLAGAIEELLLLEEGLVNSTVLEVFRAKRTEQNDAEEMDVADAVESAFMLQQTAEKEKPGDTGQYDTVDLINEKAKSRIMLDQYTSKYVADLRKMSSSSHEENESDAYDIVDSASLLETQDTLDMPGKFLISSNYALSGGAALMIVAIASVFRLKMRSGKYKELDNQMNVEEEDIIVKSSYQS